MLRACSVLQINSFSFKRQLLSPVLATLLSLTFLLALSMSSPKANELGLPAEDWALLRLSEYKNQVRKRIGRDYIVSISSLRDKFLETFDQADFEGDGISAEDFDIVDRQKKQRTYAFKIQSWLMKDLDRDFNVTRNELKIYYHKRASRSLRSGRTFIRKTRKQFEQALNDMILADMVMDKNGDDVISFNEVKNHVEKNVNEKSFNNRFSRYSLVINKQIPFSFDTDNNGIIEKREYLKIIDQIISFYDKDQNNFLSTPEQVEIDLKKSKLSKNLHLKKLWRKPQPRKLKKDKTTKEI